MKRYFFSPVSQTAERVAAALGAVAFIFALLIRPAVGQMPQTFDEAADRICARGFIEYSEVVRQLSTEHGEAFYEETPLPEHLGGRAEGWIDRKDGSWTRILVTPKGDKACLIDAGIDLSLIQALA